MIEPNIEERLSAAAFTILSDGLRHSWRAQAWAADFLRGAARGKPTAFQSATRKKRGLARCTTRGER